MRHLPLLCLACLLTACAGFDDFLGLPLGKEPAVYYPASLEASDHDTVVVAAVDGAEVIDGLTTRTLRLFLRAGHRLEASRGGPPSVFLPFTVANATERTRLTAAHPQLAGRTLYLLRLDRLRVRDGALPHTTTLAAAGPGTLSTQQQRQLAGRAVDFLLLPVAADAGFSTPATYAAVE